MTQPDPPVTVYVSIGNGDDKLSQAEWADFHAATARELAAFGSRIHGEWHSHPAAPWQNACWCLEVAPIRIPTLRDQLARLVRIFRQDSIAFAVASVTFIGADTAGQ